MNKNKTCQRMLRTVTENRKRMFYIGQLVLSSQSYDFLQDGNFDRKTFCPTDIPVN